MSFFIDKKLLEIIYYILNQNKLGINPSYSSIIKQLSMTRPTVRKYIRYLESNRYVIVHKKGRNKKVELTEKGKKLL
jgi:predicted transcriptional regulator